VAVTGLAEVTLAAREPDRLARFYVDMFRLRELSRDEDRVWLAAGDRARLGLWTPGEKEFGDRGGAHVHFAFTVAPGTLDEIAERLRDAGTDVDGPVQHDGGDRSLYARDPEGNVVEAWDLFEREGEDVSSLRK
jgi:catechol-2,3-dioxygenase